MKLLMRIYYIIEFILSIKGQWVIWGCVFLFLGLFPSWEPFLMYIILGVIGIGPREFKDMVILFAQLKQAEKGLPPKE